MLQTSLAEVRIVGRGGAGVVTAGELLGRAAVAEGRHAQATPSFGPERRGALCQCTLRVADEPILLRCGSRRPGVLLVLDPTIWRQAPVALGLARSATALFNSTAAPEQIAAELASGRCGPPVSLEGRTVRSLDATGIALQLLGRPIANTAMMGALVAATGLVGLESLEGVLAERFGAQAEDNLRALRAGYAAAAAGAA